MKELDDAKIEQLLSKPKRGSSGKLDLGLKENRNLMVWIKLPHTLAFCGNSECPDDRPRKVAEGNAMCTLIKDTPVCRLCFLDGFLLDISAAGV